MEEDEEAAEEDDEANDADDEALSRARLLLMEATHVVLARALGLMGLSAPDQM